MRGRVSDPALAALSGSQPKAPGFAGGWFSFTRESLKHESVSTDPGQGPKR